MSSLAEEVSGWPGVVWMVPVPTVGPALPIPMMLAQASGQVVLFMFDSISADVHMSVVRVSWIGSLVTRPSRFFSAIDRPAVFLRCNANKGCTEASDRLCQPSIRPGSARQK